MTSTTRQRGIARATRQPFRRSLNRPLVSRRQRLLQSLSRQFVAILAVIVLIGCSPTYDWREIQPVEAPFVIMLPGKPAAMSRQISLEGLPVTMRMHGAIIEGHSFTAAWVKLDESGREPDDRLQHRVRALAAMQKGMVRNIGGEIVSTEGQNLPLITATGQAVGQVPGIRIHVQGTARGSAAQLHAIFVGFGANLYQFVVLGPDTPAEQIDTFLNSVRLRVGKPSAVALAGGAVE